jgi:hypothetical protein
MVEEEGSSALASTESEKDTSSSEYLSKTHVVEEDEDEDINVSRKFATPRAATSTMKEVNKPILICVYSC